MNAEAAETAETGADSSRTLAVASAASAEVAAPSKASFPVPEVGGEGLLLPVWLRVEREEAGRIPRLEVRAAGAEASDPE